MATWEVSQMPRAGIQRRAGGILYSNLIFSQWRIWLFKTCNETTIRPPRIPNWLVFFKPTMSRLADLIRVLIQTDLPWIFWRVRPLAHCLHRSCWWLSHLSTKDKVNWLQMSSTPARVAESPCMCFCNKKNYFGGWALKLLLRDSISVLLMKISLFYKALMVWLYFIFQISSSLDCVRLIRKDLCNFIGIFL